MLTGLSPEKNSWSSGGGVANESRITFPPEQQMVEVSPFIFFALQKLQIPVIEMAPRDCKSNSCYIIPLLIPSCPSSSPIL